MLPIMAAVVVGTSICIYELYSTYYITYSSKITIDNIILHTIAKQQSQRGDPPTASVTLTDARLPPRCRQVHHYTINSILCIVVYFWGRAEQEGAVTAAKLPRQFRPVDTILIQQLYIWYIILYYIIGGGQKKKVLTDAKLPLQFRPVDTILILV